MDDLMPGGDRSLYGAVTERNARHREILENMRAGRLSAADIQRAYYDLARSCGLGGE